MPASSTSMGEAGGGGFLGASGDDKILRAGGVMGPTAIAMGGPSSMTSTSLMA